jgi:hypothetical protein
MPLEKKSKSVKIDYSGMEETPKKKSKLLEAEPVSEKKAKKKKKKPGTELVVATEDTPKKKKKKSLEGAKRKQAKLQAAITAELAEITSLPPAATSQEQQQLEEYLHMFRKLAKLIRKAEKQCMKSGQSRDYYALCTLMSQQREVIADIRSVSDMSGQVAQLENNVLQPMIRSVGQNMLDSFYQIKALIVNTSKPEETQFALNKLNDITTEQGKFLQMQYQNAVERMSQIMLGG